MPTWAAHTRTWSRRRPVRTLSGHHPLNGQQAPARRRTALILGSGRRYGSGAQRAAHSGHPVIIPPPSPATGRDP
ncbi:hypothetical protein, partial [Streptomyces sp. NPDC001966]